MKKRAPYGRIKETTIGGFCMPREYRNIKEYESEIFALREQGKTNREICEKFGLKQRQLEKLEKKRRRLEGKM